MTEENPDIIHSLSVYTIRDYRTIEGAIEKGSIEFTEKLRWTTAKDILNSLDQDAVLPVILADSTGEQRGVMAWGIAKSITVDERGTLIRLGEIQAVESFPLPYVSLICESTGEWLAEGDQRPYRIVRTPQFVTHAPTTYLLTWNPAVEVPLQRFIDIREQLLAGEVQDGNWTCRAINKVKAGDRFLMLRQGSGPRGIVGFGWIRSDGWKAESGASCVDIVWTWMLDPNDPLDPRAIKGAESAHWAPAGSGIELPEPACSHVWDAFEKRLEEESGEHSENDELSPPSSQTTESQMRSKDDLEDTASSVEGKLVESWSTRRERDPKNRARCLEHYTDCRCAVCEMSFLEEYGVIGRGFIHIHHEHPLGASDDMDGTFQDPIKDMKPVCPNCHAMLHRGMNAVAGKVRTIEELRTIRAMQNPSPGNP